MGPSQSGRNIQEISNGHTKEGRCVIKNYGLTQEQRYIHNNKYSYIYIWIISYIYMQMCIEYGCYIYIYVYNIHIKICFNIHLLHCIPDLSPVPLQMRRPDIGSAYRTCSKRQKGLHDCFSTFVYPNPGWLDFFLKPTLWLFNIAMENGPFVDGLPIKNGDFPWLC